MKELCTKHIVSHATLFHKDFETLHNNFKFIIIVLLCDMVVFQSIKCSQILHKFVNNIVEVE